MTLEEAIKHAEEVAYQKDLESGFDTDNEQYAMTDSERANCKKCADEHQQLAEWLKDYKRLLEQPTSDDCVSRTTVFNILKDIQADIEDGYGYQYEQWVDEVKELPLVTPTRKVGKWLINEVRGEEVPICSNCLRGTGISYEYAYCPNCGCRMIKE